MKPGGGLAIGDVAGQAEAMNVATLDSPIGPMSITETDGMITDIGWTESGGARGASAVLDAAVAQLTEYFAGVRRVFDLPLALQGGELQRAVCAEMLAIPFGETVTYGDIAKRLGAPAQAIGQACGGNRIPVVIPCHRVLGAAGLGGFSARGGVETKVALLRHEGAAGLLI